MTVYGYDLSFGYEYKLSESLNPVFQTAGGKLIRLMVVRVEYDSSYTRYAYGGQVIGLPMQSPRGHFSIGRRLPCPPLTPALVLT